VSGGRGNLVNSVAPHSYLRFQVWSMSLFIRRRLHWTASHRLASILNFGAYRPNILLFHVQTPDMNLMRSGDFSNPDTHTSPVSAKHYNP
jgi:hypothetical protein